MKKVLKVFVKDNCRECRLVRSKIDQILNESIMDNLTVKYIDADRFPRTAADADVQSVPTLLLYRDDILVWRRIGTLNYHELRDNLEA